MGKVTGFLEYTRELPQRRPVTDRINDWFEIYRAFPEENIRPAIDRRLQDHHRWDRGSEAATESVFAPALLRLA